MKRGFTRCIAFFFCLVCVLAAFSGCAAAEGEHVHAFDRKVSTAKYLKFTANCLAPTTYYYSCSCGEAGEETFTYGDLGEHDFSGEVILSEATCQAPKRYVQKCIHCGTQDTVELLGTELAPHQYQNIVDYNHVKEEATATTSAVLYVSCVACGEAGTDTFTHGDPIRALSEDEKLLLTPTSVTVSMFDASSSVYGFTYNVKTEPLRPVLQISEGNSLSSKPAEYAAHFVKEQSRAFSGKYGDSNDATKDTNEFFDYYIVKVEAALKPSTIYTYRLYDKYADVGSQTATVTTGNPAAETFTFAHVSDSQSATQLEAYFGTVLDKIIKADADFVVHTGDVVDWSRYEVFWDRMLNDNFSTVSRLPIMAISGNHENVYQSGTSETYKHFNYKLPAQTTVESGIYYSFEYGNVKFIMLNTNAPSQQRLKDEQYDWLVNELENNTCTWTVVAMHNPMFSVGNYGSDDSKNAIAKALQRQLVNLFAEYGVDIVLQGHDHCISRTYPIASYSNAGGAQALSETIENENGIAYSVNPGAPIYVMNGPAGDQQRTPNANADKSLYRYGEKANVRSWAEFTVSGGTLTVSVKYAKDDSTVATYYDWGIKKAA